jgi:hypothetical protein
MNVPFTSKGLVASLLKVYSSFTMEINKKIVLSLGEFE